MVAAKISELFGTILWISSGRRQRRLYPAARRSACTRISGWLQTAAVKDRSTKSTIYGASWAIDADNRPRSRRIELEITGILYGSKLLRFVGFPCSEVLGPDAGEEEIKALIGRCGSVFVKPL